MFTWFQFVTAFRFKSNNLLGLYVHFISFFRPPSAWMLVICYVFTFIWFHSFNRSQIQFWSFASLFTWFHSFTRFQTEFRSYFPFLRLLDFILLPYPKLNFDHLLRFHVHSISFLQPLPDWIMIIRFVFTFTWFHSFTQFRISFSIKCFVLHLVDIILAAIPWLNADRILVFTFTWFHSFNFSKIDFYLLICLYINLIIFFHPPQGFNFDYLTHFYADLILFFHSLQDRIMTICFVFTLTWFHSFTCS